MELKSGPPFHQLFFPFFFSLHRGYFQHCNINNAAEPVFGALQAHRQNNHENNFLPTRAVQGLHGVNTIQTPLLQNLEDGLPKLLLKNSKL